MLEKRRLHHRPRRPASTGETPSPGAELLPGATRLRRQTRHGSALAAAARTKHASAARTPLHSTPAPAAPERSPPARCLAASHFDTSTRRPPPEPSRPPPADPRLISRGRGRNSERRTRGSGRAPNFPLPTTAPRRYFRPVPRARVPARPSPSERIRGPPRRTRSGLEDASTRNLSRGPTPRASAGSVRPLAALRKQRPSSGGRPPWPLSGGSSLRRSPRHDRSEQTSIVESRGDA